MVFVGGGERENCEYMSVPDLQSKSKVSQGKPGYRGAFEGARILPEIGVFVCLTATDLVGDIFEVDSSLGRVLQTSFGEISEDLHVELFEGDVSKFREAFEFSSFTDSFSAEEAKVQWSVIREAREKVAKKFIRISIPWSENQMFINVQ